jgi:hypothetical protein
MGMPAMQSLILDYVPKDSLQAGNSMGTLATASPARSAHYLEEC